MSEVACETQIPHFECVPKAAAGIFKSVCGVELQQVDADSVSTEGNILIALISLVGEVEWSVFLGLPAATAEAAALKFAGFEVPFDSPDMGDAIGELANMFAGDIKAKLAADGTKADISLPNVLKADNLQMLVQNGSCTEKIGFSCELGMFWAGVVNGSATALQAL